MTDLSLGRRAAEDTEQILKPQPARRRLVLFDRDDTRVNLRSCHLQGMEQALKVVYGLHDRLQPRQFTGYPQFRILSDACRPNVSSKGGGRRYRS